MTIYDLLLMAVVLAAMATLVGALIQACTGNLPGAGHTLRTLGWGLGMYVATVCVVGLTAKQKVLALGTADCSDDWCVAPMDAREDGGEVRVEFKVWSRARRVAQREFGVKPYLLDETGRRFDAYEAIGPAFDRRVEAGESFTTVRLFRVETGAKRLDVVIRDGFGPDAFVIDASQSLLHKRTVYRIRG